MIAICPNNNEIHIYSVQQQNETWQKLHTLCEVLLLILILFIHKLQLRGGSSEFADTEHHINCGYCSMIF